MRIAYHTWRVLSSERFASMPFMWGFPMPPPNKKPEPEPEPKDDARPTEDDMVRAWRVLQASALGFEWCDAVDLADSDADMHALADLIEDGCPPSLAARIV